MSLQLAKRLLTVSEYYKMAEVGILKREERLELIHGELILKPKTTARKAAVTMRIHTYLNKIDEEKCIVSVKHPIQLDKYSEPEPDLAILHFRADFYEEKHPEPKDIMLVIEVSDTSLGYDREVKKPLFANAGIPELWIVNIEDAQVEVYKNPQNGDYAHRQDYRRGDTILLESLGFKVKVDKVLG